MYFDILNNHGDLKITGPLALKDAVNNTQSIDNIKLYSLAGGNSKIVDNGYLLYHVRYPTYEKERIYLEYT